MWPLIESLRACALISDACMAHEQVYEKGKAIQTPRGCLGAIITGEMRVYRNLKTGQRVLMHRLVAGDLFGMLALTARLDDAITELVAAKGTRILWFKESMLLDSLSQSPSRLKQYLDYLHSRIAFLNFRLACFNYASASERYEFMVTHMDQMPQMNRTEMAEYLGISRASLYRIIKGKGSQCA